MLDGVFMMAFEASDAETQLKRIAVLIAVLASRGS